MTDLPTIIENLGRALNAQEVSHYTGIGKKTVYEMAEQDRLPCYRIGSRVVFDPKSVADWLREKRR